MKTLYINVKNPLSWLKWILKIILAVTVFVIVTNGHSVMVQYTNLYLDPSVKAFLHLNEVTVGIIAMFMLLLGMALLITIDYCIWVKFDQVRYKIVIVLLAVAVNFFWWNFNQESFKQKKTEQLVAEQPPAVKELSTPYDSQIAFAESQLTSLAQEAKLLADTTELSTYVQRRSRARRQEQLNEERFMLLEQLKDLQERQTAALSTIEAHNNTEIIEHEAAKSEAAMLGRNIGKGIEIFVFVLLGVVHVLSNKKVVVQAGSGTMETFITSGNSRTFSLSDGRAPNVAAKLKGMYNLPSSDDLGVSQSRYEKFADALPGLIEIAKNGGSGLNQFCREYCEANPEMKISTLKDFYQKIKPKVEEMQQHKEEEEEQMQLEGEEIQQDGSRVYEWIRQPINNGLRQARDIFS